MSRTRALIVAAVLVVFVVAGGVLIYATRSHGGQNVTINLSVTGGTKMAPDNPTAHQNDKITINMTSDTNGEVHLHGYDIPFEVKAGGTFDLATLSVAVREIRNLIEATVAPVAEPEPAEQVPEPVVRSRT